MKETAKDNFPSTASEGDEREPFIAFHCSCGECLYTVGTAHCTAMRWEDKCPVCGQHYVCTDSLIAFPVSSEQVAKEMLSKARPIPPIYHTRRLHAQSI